ncbi:transcriptional regulator [Chania multitudinisentens RB-25]|uniref:Transcriptional regulator n=1 Tax=Chania multitudinisentens RB-25 TaxID=1441930 RepID=W0LFM6_9GAMM|nr:transcriptional regulator LeuO [Chania multitudinisentens]AHG21194.1 transcriptional regulator [Chania multitudinisentens RB-25]
MSEYNSGTVLEKENGDIHLRSVDLNLLTVFDAVMQMQNITRAANSLGMSQPAVSNAVARLKIMFNDELFVRFGRGIQPTMRARQLFGPVRQALQLVQNELPGAGFDALSSERTFTFSICSPLDIRLTAKIINNVKNMAPYVRLQTKSYLNDNIEHQLRYQETEFVIGYTCFEQLEFRNVALFEDELSLVAAQSHPRLGDRVTQEQMLAEQHAVISLERFCSFSKPYYIEEVTQRSIMQQCTDLFSVLNIVAMTEMVAITPRWFAEQHVQALQLKIIPLPWDEKNITCYLSWHESAERDKGHQWMKSVLSQSELLR